MGFLEDYRVKRAEKRAVNFEGGSYTDQKLAARHAFILGQAAEVAASSAAETGAGIIGRAVSSGRVEAGPFTPLLTPALLSGIVRGLVYYGAQAVWLRRANGRFFLQLVGHQYIDRDWLQIEEQVPYRTRHYNVSLDEVAVCLWAPNPREPYKGISPLSHLGAQMAANIEGVLQRESGPRVAHGYMMFHSPANTFAPPTQERLNEVVEEVDSKLAQWEGYEAGSVHSLSLSEGWLGQGTEKLGIQSRFGFQPDLPVVEAAKWACQEVMRSLGVPLILFSETNPSNRDSHRAFIAQTAQPIATGIASELSRVLEVPVTIDLSPVRAADDVASRARAFMNLTSAGMSLEEAKTATGLDSGTMTPPVPPQRQNPALAPEDLPDAEMMRV